MLCLLLSTFVWPCFELFCHASNVTIVVGEFGLIGLWGDILFWCPKIYCILQPYRMGLYVQEQFILFSVGSGSVPSALSSWLAMQTKCPHHTWCCCNVDYTVLGHTWLVDGMIRCLLTYGCQFVLFRSVRIYFCKVYSLVINTHKLHR